MVFQIVAFQEIPLGIVHFFIFLSYLPPPRLNTSFEPGSPLLYRFSKSLLSKGWVFWNGGPLI